MRRRTESHLKYRKVLILFFSVSLPFGILGQTSSAAEQPEFMATQIHEANTPVFGLAGGEFDTAHDGIEAAFIASDGSVFELSPNVPSWQLTQLYKGVSPVDWFRRETLSIGDVHSGYAGNEVISCAGTYPTLINVIFHDPCLGWLHETIFDNNGFVGQDWGARAGDYDPRRPGDEIFHIYEGVLDMSVGTVFSEVNGIWQEEIAYMAEVAFDSAVGDFNQVYPGAEIVITGEGPTYEMLPPHSNSVGLWPSRVIWSTSTGTGLVVKIADVDPCIPGNEIVYGMAFDNQITMSCANALGYHDLYVLFTGDGTNAMLDIAIGDVLPMSDGLEILGVDDTGSVYLVRRIEDTWQSQVIWQDPNSLYAIIAGDFLPTRSGDEILVAGESGTITLLTLTFTDNLAGDGKVNFQDFAELANYWQQSEPSADIGPWPIGDGIVNMLDLAVLTEDWLQAAYWVE